MRNDRLDNSWVFRVGLELLNSYGTDLVLWYFGYRVIDWIGEHIGGTFGKVKGHEDDTGLRDLGYLGFSG